MSNVQTNNYKYGYKDFMINFINKRTVEQEAGFLIPYLRDDIKLLDCGCGPGSITVGFGKYIKNGEIFAIDIEPSQLELTKKLANEEGITNIHLEKADICDLPFKDNTFDIVFSHAFLTHIPNYRKAIQEMKRVLKPGGIIAARDPAFKDVVIYPDTSEIINAWNFRLKMLSSAGADFSIGKKLRSILSEEGFSDVVASGTATIRGNKKELDYYIDFIIGELSESTYITTALANGTITEEEIQEYKNIWTKFRNNPGAFVGIIYCQVIGYKSE
ncbi:MAG: methyltransferase domain-containing protein [Gammaproteobacteria bacterium]|nr:methyltransferase domain-containing protein [Gammaproteobacteria bacterium]